jgi:hypothetical protein
MGIEPILLITCLITYHALSGVSGSNIKPSSIHSLYKELPYDNYRTKCDVFPSVTNLPINLQQDWELLL